MKKLNITYDTSKMENDEWITGETCYTVELEDEVADRVLNRSKPSKVTGTLIEKLLTLREHLLCRAYIQGSIKHYELVKEG